MIIPGYLVSAGLIGIEMLGWGGEMLGWGSTFCVRESKLSHVAARFEYQQFSKSAPMRLQVCLAAWPRFSSLHVPHAKSAFVFRIQTRWPLSSPGPRRV